MKKAAGSVYFIEALGTCGGDVVALHQVFCPAFAAFDARGSFRWAKGAQAALLKIEAVLPPDLRERAARTRIYAPTWRDEQSAAFAALIDRLHAAIGDSRVLQLDYCDEGGKPSKREIEPLCLAFWGGKWTLGAWCRLRADFRNFRPDRIAALDETGEVFAPVAGRDLDAYLVAVRGSGAGMT